MHLARLLTAPRRPLLGFAALGAIALTVGGCDRLGSPHDRGIRSLKSGRYEQAVASFGQAAEEARAEGDTTAEAIAYANRCYANDALTRHEEAVGDCSRSLDLVPDDAEVLNNRGVANLHLKRYEDALDDFDRALELNADYAEALANRARLWIDRQDFERAVEDLDRAVELDPELAEAYANRAFAKGSLGQKDEAFADYGRSLEIRPDAMVHFNRGMLHLAFAEFEEALQDYEAAARLEPDSYLGYMARTQAEFLKNAPRGDAVDAAEREHDDIAEESPTAEPSDGTPED